jgi:signal transduction histidine kinase
MTASASSRRSAQQMTEPFNRLSARSAGAGLGLTIVRDIMAAHLGKLEILDTQGGGTTVRLQFPDAASGSICLL